MDDGLSSIYSVCKPWLLYLPAIEEAVENLKIDASTKASNGNLVRFSFLYTYSIVLAYLTVQGIVPCLVGWATSIVSLLIPFVPKLCSLLEKTQVHRMQYHAFPRQMQLVLLPRILRWTKELIWGTKGCITTGTIIQVCRIDQYYDLKSWKRRYCSFSLMVWSLF